LKISSLLVKLPRPRLHALKFRHKMILPAALGVLAVVIATGVAFALSSRAAREMDRVEKQAVPALQVAQDLELQLAKVQRALQDAAAAGDLSGLETADALEDDLQARLAAVSADVMAPEDVQKLQDQVQGYFGLARTTTEWLIRKEQTPGLAEALRSTAARSRAIRDELADQTADAKKKMSDAFEKARALQRASVASGVVILICAALGSALLAWWFALGVSRPLEALNRAALRVAEGDLTQVIRVSSRDEVGMLAQSFRSMVERLRAIVSTLQGAAGDLASASASLGEATRAQSALLERQANGVTETSTTTRELEQASATASSRASAVLEVARRAAEMSDAGQAAAGQGLDGLKAIQDSVRNIVAQGTHLFEQARQVGEIVETVRDIASQSHVLSLNASIEAARAGEAGRGFAVVAAEVRALAEQSGTSAGRISKIVQDILSAVRAALEMTERGDRGMEGSAAQIRASGESLRQIGGIVRETSDAALHIAAAVQQQSVGIVQIASAMRDLDQGMEETVSRIQALNDAATHLRETAGRISEIVSGFRI
jgi:methyl-accepting chemotaxis protein